jgi:hypothetical protein
MVAFLRMALVLALLVGTWCSSSTFITGRSGSAVGQATALRGTPEARTQGTRRQEENSGIGAAMAPLGIALVAFAALRRQQRIPAVSRHFFFGVEEVPAPKVITSYKDYDDPWLGSCDLGFDPLNVAVGSVFDKGTAVVKETTYYNYRESEVKHGRFAMIAFLAIFFEDADRGALLTQLGIPGATDNLDATLGLDEVQGEVIWNGLGAQALAEFSLQRKENDGSFFAVEYDRNRCPGDLGFDPLRLGANDSPYFQRFQLHNVEVNSGRLAMIGITSFLFREFILKDAAIAAKIL